MPAVRFLTAGRLSGKTVAAKARALQAAHTARRDTLAKIARRLATGRTRSKPLTWLFPSLKSERDLVSDAPARLNADKKIQWAETRYALDPAALYGSRGGSFLAVS
jgi:hypothetical protein